MFNVKSISKALKILDLFLANKNDMSLGDISKSLNLNESTVSHIVSTLVAHSYLKQQYKKGNYSRGIKFLDFDVIQGESNNGNGTVSCLIELNQLVGEPVHLSFWNGNDIPTNRTFNYLTGSLKTNLSEWAHVPLHCSSMGKLMLSGMSDRDFHKYFRSRHLEKFTPNTIVDIDQMKDIISIVRREGIAFEEEETHLGVSGIAAGVKNSEGEIIGAVFMLGPSVRLTHTVLGKIAPSIKKYALKISRDLGYQA
jgi:DNA-binding IclR family transcriptional regulator